MEFVVWRDVREGIRKIDIQKSIGPLRQGPLGRLPTFLSRGHVSASTLGTLLLGSVSLLFGLALLLSRATLLLFGLASLLFGAS